MCVYILNQDLILVKDVRIRWWYMTSNYLRLYSTEILAACMALITSITLYLVTSYVNTCFTSYTYLIPSDRRCLTQCDFKICIKNTCQVQLKVECRLFFIVTYRKPLFKACLHNYFKSKIFLIMVVLKSPHCLLVLIKVFLSRSNIILFYNSYIWPHLDFCWISWGN